MLDSPTLSVVLVNYNHGKLLRRSLPALFAQTRPADEWILIDDASQDDSREIMAEFSGGRSNVTFVHHETNQGVVAAMNNGLRRARGDYVYFAAADDVALPDLFARLLQAAALHPGVGLCLADFFLFSDESGQIRRLHVCVANPASFLDGEAFGRLLVSGAIFHYPPSGAIIHRATLLELGGFDPRAEWLADCWVNLQVGLRRGVCFVPEALAGFRVHLGGFSGGGTKKSPDAGQLWTLANATAEPGKIEPLWFGLMAGMPINVRELMWWEVYRRPSCWSWILRHRWRLVHWPALRPWLWPVMEIISCVFPGKFYVAMLRLFGAKIAPDVRVARGVRVDRPWRTRFDSGTVLERGVSICAKESVLVGERAVLGSGCRVDSSQRRPGVEGTDAIIVGPRACIGANSRLYAGAAIAADASIPPNSVIQIGEATESARGELKKLLG
jgi:acetyltransferase-like isoleucine patch superfamily enzyme